MTERIAYTTNGERRFYIDGVEVSAGDYHMRTHKRDAKALEDMLRAAMPPHGVSDCTFMAGTANGRQFAGQEFAGDRYRQVAESLGGQTKGRKYLSGLARFPGDPEAWVDSRDDVKRVLEKRPGWSCEGTVNYQAPPLLDEPKPGPEVAEDLLNKYTLEVASQYPDPERIDLQDLKEQVKERIKPKNRPKKVTKADG